MAERGRAEDVFTIHGCIGDDGVTGHEGTIYWLVNTMGLDSASAIASMDKTMLDGLYKRMTKDAVEGAEAPIQNVAHRPRSGVRFMDAVNTVVVFLNMCNLPGTTLFTTSMRVPTSRRASNLAASQELPRTLASLCATVSYRCSLRRSDRRLSTYRGEGGDPIECSQASGSTCRDYCVCRRRSRR